MKIIKTPLEGCVELQPKVFQDDRGKLVKTFHERMFLDAGLESDFKEEYYSVSKKNVLRGLHFQLPPDDHVKCVTCISGSIFDVVVDLRKSSKSFKMFHSVTLNSEKGNMLYIPKGFAHGFYVLSEEAIFLNRTSTVFSQENDFGIHWNSCGIPWPANSPILSKKDTDMIELSNFNSPF